ncbi:glycosyltransferase [uncultured Desulfuromusa sp.]|uniref:glycosyltransferase n=1 Tax=uncultured Desulfuromusa sp. TaxID=219183 RepID=UPI002AA7E9FC|nr:glycosyltransferase [uncultured Desulfuromusa sp.]
MIVKTCDDSRIRIAYLIDTITCDTAGTQKQLLETIHRLDQKRFDPCLICLWQSDWMKQHELPCQNFVLGYRGFIKWNFLGVIWRLAEIIKERKLHIVQTFFEDSIFVGFLGKVFAGTSLILLSSRRDIGLGRENKPWYHFFFALMLPWVNRCFTGIVANSEQVKLFVAKKEKTGPGKIKVIYNGVVIPEKKPAKPALFADTNETVWIGLVASLTSVKRHDVLINAVSELQRKESSMEFRVLFLGEGPEYDRLTTQITELGLQNIFHFAGAVKDVPSYLYSLDIGVLCSDREGLSNAILEYMACGLPVVATSVGGNVELVDAENGICFPPEDHLALAAALQSLIENPPLRKNLGEGSLRKIQQSFSWDKTMDQLENYYLAFVSNDK